MLEELAEVEISGRQLARLAHEVGLQLQEQRDQRVEQFHAGNLEPNVTTRAALVVIEIDGGRIQVRGEGEGPGAHHSVWCEDKFGFLATATIIVSASDPEPELPESLRNRDFIEKLMSEMAGQGPLQGVHSTSEPLPSAPVPDEPSESPLAVRNRPELLVRTYVASMSSSKEFGPMVAAEARRRNFENAANRAFVGDGSAWIWTIQKEWFPTFEPIVDLLHVLSHVFTAAKAAADDASTRWTLFQSWAEAIWKGRTAQVINELRSRRDASGPISEEALKELADDDPRKILTRVSGYLERNESRMDYPRYRQQGLPWTSSHMESTVKLFNRRVKGSEKFWGETGSETILQLQAALLSEDNHLHRHLKTHPTSPYRTYKNRANTKAA
jgi:hypothetical protein